MTRGLIPEDPWRVLGIEATDDPRAVKRAYARRLKLIDQEKQAPAFEELRAAYERAREVAEWRQRVAAPSDAPEHSLAEDPVAEDPVAEDPATGDSASGDPLTENTAAENAAAADVGGGHPTASTGASTRPIVPLDLSLCPFDSRLLISRLSKAFLSAWMTSGNH